MKKNNIIDNSENPTKSTKLERIRYCIFFGSFYVYLSGALYFYGYMGKLGFKGASLDSIFSPLVFSQYFFSEIFTKAFIIQGANLLLFPLDNSLIITSLLILFAIAIKLKVLDKLSLKMTSIANNLKNPEKSFIQRNPIISAFLAFPVVYLGQAASFILFLFLSIFIMLPLYIPYNAGAISAKNMTETNNGMVCNGFNWNEDKYKNEDIILSCERIRVNKNGDNISGTVIHSDSKYLYVNTNHLLLRVKDENVVTCTNKQRNQMKKEATIENLGENSFKNCNELYLAMDSK
ncbi:hypothetical protein AAFX60_017135 [Aliivibrio fischeri]